MPKTAYMRTTANILEIFSSIQGEGIYVGERQIFIRFRDCNLDCIYCDVNKDSKTLKLTIDGILSRVKKLNQKIKHKTISITGGEPLLYWKFLNILLPKLKKEFNIYLETNGILAQELKRIINLVDVIAMDIKLPSVTKERPFWSQHFDFLKAACRKAIFIKTIVSGALRTEDFKKAVFLIKKINKNIPLVIQPVMKQNAPQVNKERLNNLQCYALKFLKNVYVIPQVHKIIGAK